MKIRAHKKHDGRILPDLLTKRGRALRIFTKHQATADERKAVTKATHSKRIGDWDRWIKYLSAVDKENDPFLQRIADDEGYSRSDYFQSFLVCYRHNFFGTKTNGKIGAQRLRQCISIIASRFEDEGLPRPVVSYSGNLIPQIRRQLQCYKNEDPPVKRQASLPLTIFETLYKSNPKPLARAIGELTAGALFFAMRSCEYTRSRKENKDPDSWRYQILSRRYRNKK